MNKKYDYAIVLGRFQPVHKGHVPLFTKAAEIAKKIIVIVGSDNQPRTIKNPFSTQERKEMIAHVLEDLGINAIFSQVEDSKYQEHDWIKNVRNAVKVAIGTDEPYAHKLKIAIIGHEKDESSFYLNHFSDWTLVDPGGFVGDFRYDQPVAATHIRDLWFARKLGYASGNLPTPAFDYITKWVHENETIYEDLVGEYEYIKKYKEETQVGPYPVQFVTSDAVVVQGGELLLIKRAEHPGKGQWALPGGFKNPKETFVDSCIRELQEETGIKIPEKVLRGSIVEEKVFDHPDRSLRGTVITKAHCIVLDPSQPRPRVVGSDDAAEAWWFPIDEVLNMRDQLFEDHHDIIKFFVARV